MGKAIAIGVVIIALALIGWAVVAYTMRHSAKREDIRAGRATKGDLTRAEEEKLREVADSAANIMGKLVGIDYATWEDPDVLTPKSREAVEHWLDRYGKVRKEIERA